MPITPQKCCRIGIIFSKKKSKSGRNRHLKPSKVSTTIRCPTFALQKFYRHCPVARQLLRQPCYCSSLALERLANYVTNVWWKFRMIRHKKGANRFTHLRNQGIAKRHLQINKQQQPTPTWAWNFVYRFILL